MRGGGAPQVATESRVLHPILSKPPLTHLGLGKVGLAATTAPHPCLSFSHSLTPGRQDFRQGFRTSVSNLPLGRNRAELDPNWLTQPAPQ